jgi:hypothetical protein
MGPVSKPVKVAAESNVTAGALKVNDAYDLELLQLPNRDLELVLFMKIQFFFEEGSGGRWDASERQKFMSDWKVAVSTAWSQRNVRRLKRGNQVHLRVSFAIQEGGWMADHWEVTVTKVKPGEFRTSYVDPSMGNVVLDSEDLTLVSKGGPSCLQRGAVHEFGHMMGLLDEYKDSAYIVDKQSVLHACEAVRPRHVVGPMQWLDAKLKKLGIQ